MLEALSKRPRANQVVGDREFAHWCVMHHARPELVKTLRLWGLKDAAHHLEVANSIAAARMAALDAEEWVRRVIRFGPLRRDLMKATKMFHAGATFAGRGDAENTSAIIIGVFVHTASAQTWRRPWTRFGWRERRAQVIATARREQSNHNSPSDELRR